MVDRSLSDDEGFTDRLMARIRTDFPNSSGEVASQLKSVESGNQDRERVLAAVVLGAAGNQELLVELVALSKLDWRDLLVSGGLAGEDWPVILNRNLGGSS